MSIHLQSGDLPEMLAISSSIGAAGLALSILSGVLLLAALAAAWRTDAFVVPLFGVRTRGTRARWVWSTLLVLGFAAGFWGMPVRSITSTEAGAAESSAKTARIVRSSLRLPCYRVVHARSESATGEVTAVRIRRALTVPWPFLLVLGAFVWSVRSARSGDREGPGRGPGSRG